MPVNNTHNRVLFQSNIATQVRRQKGNSMAVMRLITAPSAIPSAGEPLGKNRPWPRPNVERSEHRTYPGWFSGCRPHCADARIKATRCRSERSTAGS